MDRVKIMPRLRREKKTRSSICRGSHATMKMESKSIRIIHVFTPEVIKTDIANFRELVQKLTGKQTEKKEVENEGQNTNIKAEETVVATCSGDDDAGNVFGGWDVKEEPAACSQNGFDDLEGFIQSLIQLPQMLEFEPIDTGFPS